MAADLHGLTAVTLLRRYELDTAVAVLVVVPVDKRRHPLTGLVFAGERLTRLIRSIPTATLDCVYTVLNRDSEYGLSLLTRGLENDLSTPSSSRRLSSVAARNSARSLRLGVAVVGVQNQRLLTALADPLA